MTRRTLLLIILLAFSGFSGLALWQHGYLGIWRQAFANTASGQVLFDLCVALALVLTWMRSDAKRTGRPFWPWLLFTLVAGSFGPLFYLLTAPSGTRSPA